MEGACDGWCTPVVLAGRGRTVVAHGRRARPAVGLAAAVALRHRAPGRPQGGVVQLDGVPHDDVDELGGARAAPRRARRQVPDARRHGPVLTVLSLELGTTHHDKGLDRSGRGAAPTRPLRSRAADDRVPRETVSTPRAARATVFAASHDGLRIGQPRGSLRAWRRRKTQRLRAPGGRHSASRQPVVGKKMAKNPSRCRSDDKL